MPELYFIVDPVTRRMSVFLKLRLWSGMSVVGTIWMNENLRPAVGAQIVTAMSDITTTSPAQPWRIL